MRIDVLTLFPEMFEGVLDDEHNQPSDDNDNTINLIDFRTFSTNKHGKVDDAPYGGGAGMVLQVQPIRDALHSIAGHAEATKVMVTPQGRRFDQTLSNQLRSTDHLILLCGHYEGFDDRIRAYFDLEVSIGDFVMTGGELAAMAIIDNVLRHQRKEGATNA